VLELAADGAVFLLNCPFSKDDVWPMLPREVQETILAKHLKLYVIDAYKVAKAAGMGGRINTVMQTCFFAISGVLPREQAIEKIKYTIKKTYARKGDEIVQKNFAAVDQTLANLFEVSVPRVISSKSSRRPMVAEGAPDFVKEVTGMMLAGKGDLLPVGVFPVDGTWPTATSQWEKRDLADNIPVWESKLCIQCNKCAFVCPHAAIRAKVYESTQLNGQAPASFKSTDYKGADLKGLKYTIQVAPEDCTGCNLCVAVCPAKDKSDPKHKAINMCPQPPLRAQEKSNFAFFASIPEIDRSKIRVDVKGSQFFQPLIEFSGACNGCGETPYIKLMTQLFGDRVLIANATGCSSIYGGNLPTTPYCVDRNGRGPAWANSLFEDNAEFGLGMRLAVDQQKGFAELLLKKLASKIGENLVNELLNADQSTEALLAAQRERVIALREVLAKIRDHDARVLGQVADYLVRKNVWVIGGDGWAYDIGFGGLDHVLASGHDVNVLVLDTEVYSNTGGQSSKSTPLAAVAKFAAAGKSSPKKDLGLMAMSYGNVYVARVAFGAKDTQTVKAFQEAESYNGPSLIIAYSHCIAHGYDLMHGCDQQKLAVDCGVWPLYRFDPRKAAAGESAMSLDSPPIKSHIGEYVKNEARFRMTEQLDAQRYRDLLSFAKRDIERRNALYQALALPPKVETPAPPKGEAVAPAGARVEVKPQAPSNVSTN
jgi:pyruvate-ferredoxin/flavodoxin oxidoreductase